MSDSNTPKANRPALAVGADGRGLQVGLSAKNEAIGIVHEGPETANHAALTALARLLGRRLAREAAKDN